MADIDKYRPISGRLLKEDGTYVNVADFFVVGPDGGLKVNMTVLAEIADSKVKGSTDGGATDEGWKPIKVGADGTLQVQLNGSFATLRPMLGATKTASGVASEVFAGAGRLAGRRGISIKNEHPYLRLRIDGSAVTDTTGIALEPFAQAVFALDPAVDVPVYVISEAGLVKYGVVEW